ncbi:hypothetical protein KSP39_PZI016151 [Platanthera zijinensis]|uniref:Uncharacterized protein n=1 Tax=Platanthera zijinensis TaxID=2320716 RepID=A0AAP0B8B2_9ASPA
MIEKKIQNQRDAGELTRRNGGVRDWIAWILIIVRGIFMGENSLQKNMLSFLLHIINTTSSSSSPPSLLPPKNHQKCAAQEYLR